MDLVNDVQCQCVTGFTGSRCETGACAHTTPNCLIVAIATQYTVNFLFDIQYTFAIYFIYFVLEIWTTVLLNHVKMAPLAWTS